ncbi:hypothetical protein GH733_011082 [Mirounga leonina]|nr:hypothetical protein GH733_011082 [Mirounga leonina]
MGQGTGLRPCGGREGRRGPCPASPHPCPGGPPKTSVRAPGSCGVFRGSRSSAPLRVLGSGSSPASGQGCSEKHGQGARPLRAPPAPPGPGSGSGSGSGPGLPRNVLSERERRKRISVSCERLRALLPRFDGRREDMASVLEMAVQFLQLAGTLVPSQEPHAVSGVQAAGSRCVLGPSKETWREWQRDVMQQAASRPSAAGPPDCSTGACGLTVLVSPGPRAPPGCVTAGTGEGEAPSGVTEGPEGPPALPGLDTCCGSLIVMHLHVKVNLGDSVLPSAVGAGSELLLPKDRPPVLLHLGPLGVPGSRPRACCWPLLCPALLSSPHTAWASWCSPDPSVIHHGQSVRVQRSHGRELDLREEAGVGTVGRWGVFSEKLPWPQVPSTAALGVHLRVICLPPASELFGPRAGDSRQGPRAAARVGKADPHLVSAVEPCSLLSQPPGPSPSKALRLPPPWPPRLWQPPSPLVSEEAQSCLGQAGTAAEGADCVVTLDARSVSGCDVEDGTSYLLNAGPDWWLGSLEGRGASAPSQSTARSSLLDRAEPGFLTDPEPGSQELPDGPLEPWGSDVGCPSLALREEVDSIFPDFFPC